MIPWLDLWQAIPPRIPVIPGQTLRDALEVVYAASPAVGAALGAGFTVKKIWNGTNDKIARVREDLKDARVTASSDRDMLLDRIDSFSEESRADRARLHESITHLVDRTGRIEGSCLLHQQELAQQHPRRRSRGTD